MSRHDLRDMTFCIPVKIDSEDRKRNLRTAVGYLLKHFDTQVVVLEEGGPLVAEILGPLHRQIIYQYVPSDPVQDCFHRTRHVNAMVRDHVRTPLLCIYDADVLMHPQQYLEGAALLREGCDLVYPFDGRFWDIIEPSKLTSIVSELELGVVTPAMCNGIYPYTNEQPLSVGACIFFRRDSFVRGGMENEHFVSWGPEDQELQHRFLTLGYRVERVTSGSVYHLHHQLNEGSRYRAGNFQEFDKVRAMDGEQLRAYVQTWPWVGA